jgi:hypothetical protein
MTTTGNYIARITQKLAVLKNEISMSGKISYLNIHKQAENLFRDVLTLTYGVELINLNETRTNFEGLDIGNQSAGIAYQVTSQNTAEKVNDTLAKAINYDHHKIFFRIIIFMLSDKKPAYTIKPLSDPSFSFNPDTDILDFSDLIKKIESLPNLQIKAILDHLDTELVYPELKKETAPATSTFLIDVQRDMALSKLPFYYHFAVKLNTFDREFSVAELHRHFEHELNSFTKKTFLPIFYTQNRKSQGSAREMKYEVGLKDSGAVNHFKHSMLVFKPKQIEFEWAQYRSNEEINSNLNEEVGGLLTLLITLKSLYGKDPMGVQAEIAINCNGKLFFYLMDSIFSIKGHMVSYYLDPPVNIKKAVKTIATAELMALMQDICDSFVAEPIPFMNIDPFMTIEPNNQKIALETLKNRIGPTLSEIFE